jgi:uncharacterized protein (DUF433 family)
MTEMALLRRIVIDPKIIRGKPVIRGARLTVEIVVEKMAHGATFQDIKKDYPFVTTDDIRAALLYAAKSASHEEIYAA